MKACLLRSPAPISSGPLKFVDIPTPTPGGGEVRGVGTGGRSGFLRLRGGGASGVSGGGARGRRSVRLHARRAAWETGVGEGGGRGGRSRGPASGQTRRGDPLCAGRRTGSRRA